MKKVSLIALAVVMLGAMLSLSVFATESEAIPATAVTVEPAIPMPKGLMVGESFPLKVTLTPENATATITYGSVSSYTFFDVTQDGIVTATSIGSSTTNRKIKVTATNADGSTVEGIYTIPSVYGVVQSTSSTVTVYAAGYGTPATTGTCKPTAALELSNPTFTSENPDILTVDADGVVSPVAAGEGTVNVTATRTAPDGHTYEVSGSFTVKVKKYPVFVETPDGTRTSYSSLATAVEEAVDGSTITLLDDWKNSSVSTSNVAIQSNVTIDLGGHTVTQPGSSYLFYCASGKSLVLKNGTISVSGRGRANAVVIGISNGSSVTFENIQMTVQYHGVGVGIASGSGSFSMDKDSSITMPALTSPNASNGVFVNPGVSATIELDGKITADACVQTNGSSAAGQINITVNENADLNGKGTGMYLPYVTEVNINGGTITGGNSAVEVRAGTLNVNGGTLTATAAETSVTSNTSGATTKGAAIAAVQHTTALPLTVNISDGTLVGNTAFLQVDVEESGDPSLVTVNIAGGDFRGTEADVTVEDTQTGFISGDTFTTDVSGYCASGFTAKVGEDGSFEIVSAQPFTGFSENMLIIPMGEVTGERQIALIMGIDTLRYSEVGFDVALNGESLGSYASTVVYRQVKDGAGNVWTSADLAGKADGYLFANTMGISPEHAAEDFGEGAVVTVTPYAVTLDGEKVTVNSYDIPIANFFN